MIIIIIFISKKKKKADDDSYIYKNIPKKKMILNSFKLNGENYNPIVGNMNNGNDYEENDRTNFDLYVSHIILLKEKIKIIEYFYIFMEADGLVEQNQI